MNEAVQTELELVPRVAKIGEQVMPFIDGKSFRCECGCNVFTKSGDYKYVCNSCELSYTGEP